MRCVLQYVFSKKQDSQSGHDMKQKAVCSDHFESIAKRPIISFIWDFRAPSLLKWFHSLYIYYDSNMVEKIPLSSSGVLLETDLPHLEQRYFLCWLLYVLEYCAISVSTLIWLKNVSYLLDSIWRTSANSSTFNQNLSPDFSQSLHFYECFHGLSLHAFSKQPCSCSFYHNVDKHC